MKRKVRNWILVLGINGILLFAGYLFSTQKGFKEELYSQGIAFSKESKAFHLSMITQFKWERLYFISSEMSLESEEIQPLICAYTGTLPAGVSRMYFVTKEIVNFEVDFFPEDFIRMKFAFCNETDSACGFPFSTPSSAVFYPQQQLSENRKDTILYFACTQQTGK